MHDDRQGVDTEPSVRHGGAMSQPHPAATPTWVTWADYIALPDDDRRELIDDYVELISDLINEVGEARQVDMAARLGVSQPTVAKMLKRLASVGLIEQIPWRGIFLTPEGEKLAQESRERHQIVENFLLAIGVSQEIARRDAEGMEHHVSEETLAMFLKFTQKQGSQEV